MENKPEHFHQGLWWPLIQICGWGEWSSHLTMGSEVTETQRSKGAQRQTEFTETEAGHYTYGAKLSNVWLQAGWGPASYLV